MTSSVTPAILAAAIEQANHSRCLSQRGCVIWSTYARSNQTFIVGRGFNKHTGTQGCKQNEECKSNCSLLAIHAEQIALLDALWNNMHIHNQPNFMVHVKIKEGKLVPSGPPSCLQCSKLILLSPMKITGVFLYHELGWQCYDTLSFHKQSIENDKQVAATVLR